MMFGTTVVVDRGSPLISSGPGSSRQVRGVLVGARGNACFVRLLQDDELSTVPKWSHKGDVGRWSKSVVSEERRK